MITRKTLREMTIDEMIVNNKAVGYVRVSSQEQVDEGLSIDVQVQKIREACQLRDLDIVEIFVEEGVSGYKELDKRPESKKMLAMIKKHEIKNVVTLKLDRLFRNASDALTKIDHFDAQGIALHLINMSGAMINTRTAFGKMFIQQMAIYAEFERNLTGERTREVLGQRRKNGKVSSAHVPFGFSSDDEGNMIEDEEEQAILADILDMKQDGLSLRKIASELNEMGIAPKQGGKKWYASTVSHILKTSERQ